MGSGSSKKRKHVSASEADVRPHGKNLNNGLNNGRSISVPTYLASLHKDQGENEVFIEDNLKNSSSNHNNNTAAKSSRISNPITSLESSNLQKEYFNNTTSYTNDNMDARATNVPNYPLPSRTDADGSVAKDQSFLTVTELYNILTAESWLGKPQLHNPNYLLLLDCRNMDDYRKGHIISAKHHTCLQTEFGCLIDIPRQLNSYYMIVLHDDTSGMVAESLQSRNIGFYSLNLHYNAFSNKYPFLCTTEVINTSDQRKEMIKTWPSEIIDDRIYQGTAKQALDKTVIQALGLTHIINVTLEHPNAFQDTVKYMRIQLDDDASVDLLTWLPKTTQFISEALGPQMDFEIGDNNSVSGTRSQHDKPNRVLIHCNLGRSRSSTIMLGYLMEIKHWSLQDACNWLTDCRSTAKPNVGFLNQLLLYEEKVFGRKISDFSKLPF